MKPYLFCPLAALLAVTAYGASPLISGNDPGNAFAADQSRLETYADVTFETAGEFATEPEFLATASRPNGTNRALFDGAKGTDGNCQAFGKWQGGKYFANLTIDLKDFYAVDRVTVWTQQSATQGLESFDVFVSNDGKNFTLAGTQTVPADLAMSTPQCGEAVTLALPQPVTGRFVKIILRKDPKKMQMIISEVAVFGNKTTPPASAATPVKTPVSEKLLSGNNMGGNAFNADEPRLETGAAMTLESAEPFPTEPEFLTTASRPNGGNRVLLDGAKGTDGECQAFGKWQGGKYFANLTVDLKSEYLITKTAIWSQETATQGVESFETFLSNDGVNFVSAGNQAVPANLVMSTPQCGEKIEFQLPQPAKARFVKLIIRKNPNKMQMIVSEIAVYGDQVAQ